jgi:hypothetical protein
VRSDGGGVSCAGLTPRLPLAKLAELRFGGALPVL